MPSLSREPMTELEINEYLIKKVFNVSGDVAAYGDVNFFNWPGFGILWDWAQKEKWYRNFRYQVRGYSWGITVESMVNVSRVNPDAYARDITGYLKKQDWLEELAANRLPGHP